MSSETFALITSCPLQPFCAGRTCGHYKAEFFLWHFPEAPLMCHCNAFSSQCPKIEPSGGPAAAAFPRAVAGGGPARHSVARHGSARPGPSAPPPGRPGGDSRGTRLAVPPAPARPQAEGKILGRGWVLFFPPKGFI